MQSMGMRPIVADVAWPVRLYVGHNVSPTKKPEPIDAGPKNPCIVWGPDPRLEGGFCGYTCPDLSTVGMFSVFNVVR